MTNCLNKNHKTDKLTYYNGLVKDLMGVGQNLKNNRYGKQV
jgi:hypothetical protein